MKEQRLVEQTGDVPVTADSLVRDFAALGLEAGDVVIVHASLSSLGWVCGGAVAVIDAISRVLGPAGTLVMPTHSSQLSEPSHWRNPPVPSSWWPIIRETMPPFDPRTTPTRGMGALAETFRTLPGVVRSAHPQVSFAARGPRAEDIAGNHDTDFGLGEGSPVSRLYDLQGQVLLIGVGHESNTSLHLAEYRLPASLQRERQEGAPVLIDGARKWIEIQDLDVCASDFPPVGKAFEQSPNLIRQGRVGKTTTRLMPQRALVDFAVQWMTEHRTPKPSSTPAAITPNEPRNDTSVREWRHDDLDAAAAVFVTCFSEPPWSETWTQPCARTRLGDIAATPRFRGVVAYQADALAAIAMGHIEESKDDAEFLLQELCVAPPVQKTGVGTRLVRTLAEALADEGVEKLYLITTAASPATRFFRRVGLAESGRAIVMGGEVSALLGDQRRARQPLMSANDVPSPEMRWRAATLADIDLLAGMNALLIEDEGHRTRRTQEELCRRVKTWLTAQYKAVVFSQAHDPVGYALYRADEDSIYLRQLFIARDRRRRGLGRCAVGLLREEVWPKDSRVTVEVLVGNQPALQFWQQVGFGDYAITLSTD